MTRFPIHHRSIALLAVVVLALQGVLISPRLAGAAPATRPMQLPLHVGAAAACPPPAGSLAVGLVATADNKTEDATIDLDVGERVKLIALGLINQSTKRACGEYIEIHQTHPSQQVLHVCHKNPCKTHASSTDPLKAQYRAILFIPKEHGACPCDEVKSNVVHVNWLLGTLDVKACLAANPKDAPCTATKVHAGEKVNIRVSLPSGKQPGPTWDQILIRDSTTTKTLKTCTTDELTGNTCFLDEQKWLDTTSPTTAITLHYDAIAINADKRTVADSGGASTGVEWDPYEISATIADANTYATDGDQLKVDPSKEITVHVSTTEKLAEGVQIKVLDTGHADLDLGTCDTSTTNTDQGATCDLKTGAPAPNAGQTSDVTSTYIAQVVGTDDPANHLAGKSTATQTVNWKCGRIKQLLRLRAHIRPRQTSSDSQCPVPAVDLTAVDGKNSALVGENVSVHLHQSNDQAQLLPTDRMVVEEQAAGALTSRLAPNQAGNGLVLGSCSNGSEDCTLDISEPKADRIKLVATVLDENGDLADCGCTGDTAAFSSPVEATWFEITSSVDPDPLLVGEDATLTFKVQPDLSGYSATVDANGTTKECVSDGPDKCTVKISSPDTPNSVPVTLHLKDMQTNTDGPTSDTMLKWAYPEFNISASTQETQPIDTGKAAHLEVSVTPNVPDTYSIQVVGPGGTIECSGWPTCTSGDIASPTDPGPVTVTVQVLNTRDGNAVVPPGQQETIQWGNPQFTVHLNASGGNSPKVPVGQSVALTATASPSLPQGYKIVIGDSHGQTNESTGGSPCPGSTCGWSPAAQTEGTDTFTAWVVDPTGKQLLPVSNSVMVTWFPDPCGVGQDACLTLNQNEGDDYTKVTATWFDDKAPSGAQATFSWDGSAYNPVPVGATFQASLDINLNGGQVYGAHTVAVNDGSYQATANYYIDICQTGVSVCLYAGNCSTRVVSCIYNASTSFAVSDTVYGYYQDKTCAGGNENTIDYGPSGPRNLGSETLSGIGTAYGYWSAQDPGSHTIVTSDNCVAPRQATYSVFGTPLETLARVLLGFAPPRGISPLSRRSVGSKPPGFARASTSPRAIRVELTGTRPLHVRAMLDRRVFPLRLM